ncbi:MAG: hypothetical protein QOE86_220 [Solirubrobacteraceae bacterium]|nr:hypothetical protein [Solirubrobacteraceae bacterium]
MRRRFPHAAFAAALALLCCFLLPAAAQAATLSGTITDSVGGTPLEGVQVSYSGQSATTDASGHYGLTVAAQSGAELQLTGGGPSIDYVAKRVAISTSGDTVHDETMAVGGHIAGTVKDAQTGQPIPGATMELSMNGTTVSPQTTAADGTYVFHALAPSTSSLNRLTVVAPGTGPFINDISQTVIPVAVTAGEQTTNDFTLQRGGTVTGRITAPDGHGVAGASVGIMVPQPYPQASKIGGHGTTDASGTYTLHGVDAGSGLTATANPPFDPANPDHGLSRVESGPFDLAVDGTTVVDLKMVTGATLTGRILTDDTHQPLERVAVRAVNASNQLGAATLTAADGVYRLTGLAPGHYRINVTTNEGAPATTAAYYGTSFEFDVPDGVTTRDIVLSKTPPARPAIPAPPAAAAKTSGSSKPKVSATGVFSPGIKVSCKAATACGVSTTAIAAGKHVYAKAKGKLAAGKSSAVKLKLSKAGLRALKRRKVLKVVVKTVVTAPGRAPLTVKRTLTLRAPKGRA